MSRTRTNRQRSPIGPTVPLFDEYKRVGAISVGRTPTSILDDFNRPDGGFGANWVSDASFQIVSNAGTCTGTDKYAIWNADMGTPDLWVETAELLAVSGGAFVAVLVRRPATGGADTYYEARFLYTTQAWELRRVVAGTPTLLASNVITGQAYPHRIRLSARTVAGDVKLKVYELTLTSKLLRIDYTDSSGAKLTTGNYIGLHCTGTTPTFDDFSGGALH